MPSTASEQLEREEISQKQIAVADRIVLTKLDLAGPAAPALLRRLEEFNAGAPVLIADHGRIDSLLVFNAGLYDPLTKSADVNSWLSYEPMDTRTLSMMPTSKPMRSCAEESIRAVTLTLFLEALAEHCGARSAPSQGHCEHCRKPRPAGGDPRRPACLSPARLARSLAVG